MTKKDRFDIYERSLEFAAQVAILIEKLPRTLASVEYGRQVIKASGSIGANIAEADGTLTKKDFVSKMGIARREARESRHWLTLIKKTGIVQKQEDKRKLEGHIQESHEIMLIVSSIINNTQKKD